MKQSVRAVKQSPCGVRTPSTDIHNSTGTRGGRIPTDGSITLLTATLALY